MQLKHKAALTLNPKEIINLLGKHYESLGLADLTNNAYQLQWQMINIDGKLHMFTELFEYIKD